MTIPYRPNSSAALLRAACILRIGLRSVRVGDWRPISAYLQDRPLQLDVELLAVLKGAVDWAPHSRLHLTATQAANRGPRFVAVPGIWSRVDLSPGTELIAFASAGGAAADVLDETACFRLSPAAEVQSDLDLAAQVTASGADLASAVHQIVATMPRVVGPLLAQALADLVWDAWPRPEDGLAAVLSLLLSRQLPAPSRYVLLSDLVSGVLLRDPAPDSLIAPVVRAGFQLLGEPAAEPLHENLITTYLPNLLGLEGGALPRAVQDVYPDPADRAAALAGLGRHALVPEAAGLAAWLQS